MKVCIITSYGEDVFIPKGINHLTKQFKSNIDIVYVSGFFKIKRIIFFFFLLRFNELLEILLIKARSKFHYLNKKNNKNNFFYFRDINSKNFINFIKMKKYNLIVSYSCPQIIKKKTLKKINKLKIDIVNFHPGILPKYRGIFTNYYSLINKEKNVGITLHKITTKIDGGDIISALKIPIKKNDTIFSLYKKIYLSEKSLRFICKSIRNYNLIKFNVKQNDLSYSYKSYPKFFDLIKFRFARLFN